MTPPFPVLQDLRILSLALNVPGPAALIRCRAMGARCTKLEPPAGDPLQAYSQSAYAEAQRGVRVLQADLKTEAGRQVLQRELADADVLLTSFRPSALARLGLGWDDLQQHHPALSHVAIVGSPGPRAEDPGHDLTYLADNDLVTGLDLPPTLYADMSGALLAVEAVLQAALLRRQQAGVGVRIEVALADGAAWLALPRRWGITQEGGAVGGAHAGYRVYACRDGRVAVAALEPHFAAALCAAAGIEASDLATMLSSRRREALARFFGQRTRVELEQLARECDLPLHTLPAA
ncbi:MAG TPA: CoA transferase [Ramlibacter sp.]|nr:CoA transferase [Ramlibacter sp.]